MGQWVFLVKNCSPLNTRRSAGKARTSFGDPIGYQLTIPCLGGKVRQPIHDTMISLYYFKTLRARMAILLVLPVVLILLVAGISGFVYARMLMLRQWHETVVLQLKRATHQIEMRLSRPLELMKMFSQNGSDPLQTDLLETIVGRLKTLPGVVRVNLNWQSPPAGMGTVGAMRGGMGSAMGGHRFMRFHRGALARIAPPTIDERSGAQTVNIAMVLLNAENAPVGRLEIIIKFDFLTAAVSAAPWWQAADACIVDKATGRILFASSRMQGRKKLGETGSPLENRLLQKIKQDSTGTIRGRGHPPRQVAGFDSFDTLPWALVVITDGKTILAPIIRFRNGFILGAAILTLLVYMIIHLNAARMSRTIRRLSQQAGAVAAGGYGEKLPIPSRDEIGQLAGSFNAMIDGLKERDAIRNTFGRYVDPDFARTLLQRPETGRLGGKREEVVVLMADIRGFTPLAERLSPEATIEVLNRFFSAVIPLIQCHRGIIVDFVGDSILAFFEPIDESLTAAVQRGVSCAFDMHAAIARLNGQMAVLDLPALKMGIGINSGPVVVGNIGSEARRKYGIVGSTVNIAQRIQGRSEGGEVLVSQAVWEMIKSQVAVKRTFSTVLKGVSPAVQLYAVVPNDVYQLGMKRN